MVAAALPLDTHRERRRGQILVALAATAWSSAGVLQRSLDVGSATQVAGRALFAVPVLAVYVVLSGRRRGRSPFASLSLAELVVALCTAVASSAFILALNHTTVANVLFLQAIAPFAAALIAWVALRERVSGRTAVAIAFALAGVGIMVGGPGGAGGIGFALSIVMTLSFALGVVITRHRRDISMARAVLLSQVLVLLAYAPFSHPGTVGGHDLWLLALLGVGQMSLGLIFLTTGARLLPAAEVALITLLELVLGPLAVWLAYSEQPGTATLVGGAVVVGAVLLMAGRAPVRSPG